MDDANIRRPSSRPKDRNPTPSYPGPRNDNVRIHHHRYMSDSRVMSRQRENSGSSQYSARSQASGSRGSRKNNGGSGPIANSYDLLVNAIIRPPRAHYRPQDLGPQNLSLRNNLTMVRRDFQVTNRRGQLLVCSRWAPTYQGSKENVCVLYLHGNSSCRMDVLRSGVLNTVATIGYSLVAFDFSGSGLSDGDYVSLGYFEKQDIEDVIQFIIQRGWATKMVLWGRSMGAASALLYTSQELASVTAMVLDSPFGSLTTVAMDLVENSKVGIPGFMVKGFLQFLRMSVQKRAGFDINDLEPVKAASNCHCPALFLTATNDKMVFPKHGKQLARKYGGACQRLEFVGTHNSHRPSLALKASAIFLRTSVEAPHKMDSAFDTVRQLFGIVTEEFPQTNPLMEQQSKLPPSPSFTDFLFGGSRHGSKSSDTESSRRSYPNPSGNGNSSSKIRRAPPKGPMRPSSMVQDRRPDRVDVRSPGMSHRKDTLSQRGSEDGTHHLSESSESVGAIPMWNCLDEPEFTDSDSVGEQVWSSEVFASDEDGIQVTDPDYFTQLGEPGMPPDEEVEDKDVLVPAKEVKHKKGPAEVSGLSYLIHNSITSHTHSAMQIGRTRKKNSIDFHTLSSPGHSRSGSSGATVLHFPGSRARSLSADCSSRHSESRLSVSQSNDTCPGFLSQNPFLLEISAATQRPERSKSVDWSLLPSSDPFPKFVAPVTRSASDSVYEETRASCVLKPFVAEQETDTKTKFADDEGFGALHSPKLRPSHNCSMADFQKDFSPKASGTRDGTPMILKGRGKDRENDTSVSPSPEPIRAFCRPAFKPPLKKTGHSKQFTQVMRGCTPNLSHESTSSTEDRSLSPHLATKLRSATFDVDDETVADWSREKGMLLQWCREQKNMSSLSNTGKST